MTNQIIQELLVEADKADSLGKVKESLKEIKGAMIAIGDEGSEDFKKLAKAAGDLKDKVEDANAAIDRANPDKFNGLASAAKIAATGIQLTTGAMALFGDESEDVQKALMKVQAAMMFAEGLQNVKELSKDWNVMTNAIKSNVIVQKLVTAAQWLWNAALMANPIVLIIAGVVALGAAVYGLSKAFSSERSESEKLTEALDTLTKARERNAAAIDQTLKIQKALGLAGEEELKASLQAIKSKIADLDKEQAAYKALIDVTDEQRDAEKERSKQLNSLLNEEQASYAGLANFRRDLEDKAAEDQKKSQDKEIEEDQNRIDKSNEKAKEDAKEKIKVREDYNKETEKLREEYRRSQMDSDLLEIEDKKRHLADLFFREIISAEQFNLQSAAIDQAYKDKKKAEADQEWQDAIAQGEKEMESYNATLEEKYVLLVASNKKIAEEESARFNARLEMAKQLNDGLQGLSDLAFTARLSQARKGGADEERLLRQQFNVNKALQLSMTAINGIQNGITAYGAGLKAASAGGITAVAAPAWGAAYAAISGIGTLAALAKIASTQFGSAGSGGGGVGSPPSLGAINTPPAGIQPSNQLDENGNVLNQQQQPQQQQRVYVVESDITSTQNNVMVTEAAMRFQ